MAVTRGASSAALALPIPYQVDQGDADHCYGHLDDVLTLDKLKQRENAGECDADEDGAVHQGGDRVAGDDPGPLVPAHAVSPPGEDLDVHQRRYKVGDEASGDNAGRGAEDRSKRLLARVERGCR